MRNPLKYSDVTVEQYEKLQLIKQKNYENYIDYLVEKISMFSGKSTDELEQHTPKEIYDMGAKFIYADDEMPNFPFKEIIKIGNKEFKFTDVLSVAQERDATEFIKNNVALSKILAIIFKEKTNDGFKYISDNHFENAEIFKQARLEDVSGAVFFYSKISKDYEKNLLTSLEKNYKQITEIQLEMAKDKEFQSFLKNGGSITT